jgi:hypothetical protein
VTFYVGKSLAHGPIRFGVTPRLAVEQIDSEPVLSTGTAGDFVRRRHQGFYFADTTEIGAPNVPKSRSISNTPFWESMRPQDARGWIFVGLMAFGAILVIMGLAVVVGGRWQGWIEVIIGAAMTAVPIAFTAKERRDIRTREEQERAQREERERRNREMLSAYSDALAELRKQATPEALARATRERQQLELPYKVWAPLGRRTVLHVGFEALDRLGPARADEVAREIDRAASAVGLTEDDAGRVKLDLYSVIVWHLLADDRLGRTQLQLLESIRRDFGVAEGDAPTEAQAMEEFDALRGVRTSNLPRQQIPTPLKFQEYGIYTTRAAVLGRHADTGSLHLTNRNLILDARRRIEIPLSQIDDVEVDPNENTLTLRVAEPLKPLQLRVERPIYTAALIDLATNIDERPRSFA